MKTKNRILSSLCLLVLSLSCINNKAADNTRIDNEERLSERQTTLKDSLQVLTINIDFKNTKEITKEIDEIEWHRVNFDSGFILNIGTSVIDRKLTFKIPLTAINIPMTFTQQIEKDKYEIKVIQLFNTVHSDDFIFVYNSKRKDWDLEKATHTIFTNQSQDIICPYIINTKLDSVIDIRNMEMGNEIIVFR